MFYITEEGRATLWAGHLSQDMRHLLEEIERHPGEVSWSLIPIVRALQQQSLALKLIEERNNK